MDFINITDNNFKEVIPNLKLLVIDFSAKWCGPCKALSPKFDELSHFYKGKIIFIKIDVDENPEIASEYGIRSIPTVLLFKNGEKIDTVMSNNISEIKNIIDNKLLI